MTHVLRHACSFAYTMQNMPLVLTALCSVFVYLEHVTRLRTTDINWTCKSKAACHGLPMTRDVSSSSSRDASIAVHDLKCLTCVRCAFAWRLQPSTCSLHIKRCSCSGEICFTAGHGCVCVEKTVKNCKKDNQRCHAS